MDSTEIGRLLLLLRKERGLTQKQLAQALHVSAQASGSGEFHIVKDTFTPTTQIHAYRRFAENQT